jgi:hypothetical protein
MVVRDHIAVKKAIIATSSRPISVAIWARP